MRYAIVTIQHDLGVSGSHAVNSNMLCAFLPNRGDFGLYAAVNWFIMVWDDKSRRCFGEVMHLQWRDRARV